MTNDDEQIISILICKRIIGKASEEECEVIDLWRKKNKWNEEAYKHLLDSEQMRIELSRAKLTDYHRPLQEMKRRLGLHEPTSGYEALSVIHKGNPINSLYSYRYAGMVTDAEGVQAYGWYNKQGTVNSTPISSSEFTVDDVVFSGGLDPKVVASLRPEITWRGFSLSALLVFYGGHYMRAGMENYTHAVSSMAADVDKYGYPEKVEAGLIGSCTNSSYQDLSRAASLARQAVAKHLKVQTPLYINPGSEQIRYTAERDGIIADFERVGAVVMANACGPCIGQWRRHACSTENIVYEI